MQKYLFVLAAVMAALSCTSAQVQFDPELRPNGEGAAEVAATPPLPKPVIVPAPGPAGPQGSRGATGVSGETRVIVRHRTIARGPNRAQEYRQNLNDFRDMGGVTRGEVAAGYYNKTESDAAHIGLAGMVLSTTTAPKPVVIPAPAAGSAVAPEEGKKMGAFEWLALLGLVGLILVALAASNRQPAPVHDCRGLIPGGRSASTPLTADAAIERGYEVVWHDTPQSSYLRAVPRYKPEQPQLPAPPVHNGSCVGEGEALVRVRVRAADILLGACVPEPAKTAPAVAQTFNFGALFGQPGANQPAGQQPDARKGGGKGRPGGAQGGRDEVPAQTN